MSSHLSGTPVIFWERGGLKSLGQGPNREVILLPRTGFESATSQLQAQKPNLLSYTLPPHGVTGGGAHGVGGGT